MSLLPLLFLIPLAKAETLKRGEIEGCGIKIRELGKSTPGLLLLSVYRESSRGGGVAHLLALEANGKVSRHRSFEHYSRPLVLRDFREITPGNYGYFVAATGESAKYYFLNSDFQDVLPSPVPNYDPALDPRAAAHRPEGGFFFLFAHPGGSEIQERNSRGNAPFTWNAAEALRVPATLRSLSWDSSGGLLTTTDREVLDIHYPQGDVRWKIPGDDWKFIGDDARGFLAPLSAVRVENGDLLLIDERGPHDHARVVEYGLDLAAKTARLVWQYVFPSSAPPSGIGNGTGVAPTSVQRLGSGNTLVARGGPEVWEVSPRGEPVREWVLQGGYFAASAYLLEKN